MLPRGTALACVGVLAASGCGLILDPRPRDAATPEDLDAGLDADVVASLDTGVDASLALDAARDDAHAFDAPVPLDAPEPALGSGCFCGDGLVGPDEECDPGPADDPGCVECRLQPGFTCVVDPVAYVFSSPTSEASAWSWTLDDGLTGAAVPTDEAGCLGGYVFGALPAATDRAACPQWVSLVPSGCGIVPSIVFVDFRTRFSVPAGGGPIVLGLGVDNFLEDVAVDGASVSTVAHARFRAVASDEWPAPQWFVELDLAPGEHELVVVVKEGSPLTTDNNTTGLSVVQVRPSRCVPSP